MFRPFSFRIVDDDQRVIGISSSSGVVTDVLTLVDIADISFNNPNIQDLVLEWDFIILATISFLHLGPIEIRDGMLGTPHGSRPTAVIPVGQTRNEVHGLPIFAHYIVLMDLGISEFIPGDTNLVVLICQDQGVVENRLCQGIISFLLGLLGDLLIIHSRLQFLLLHGHLAFQLLGVLYLPEIGSLEIAVDVAQFLTGLGSLKKASKKRVKTKNRPATDFYIKRTKHYLPRPNYAHSGKRLNLIHRHVVFQLHNLQNTVA